VERSAFPRDKVCGECLSALGRDVLDRLGVADRLAALGPAELRRSRAVTADGRAVTLPLPRPMWGLTRHAMDAALLDVVREAGGEVLQPCVCERIEPGERPRLHPRSRGASPLPRSRGQGRDAPATGELSADLVMVGDGGGSLLGSRRRVTGDFGIKAHFTGVDADRDLIELVGLGGGRGYAGLAPVQGGRWNAAWGVPVTALRRFGGDIDALVRDHIRRHPTLCQRFARAQRVGEWLACPLPRFAVVREWPANVVPLGNAAAALEPVGGEGMGLAMRSAELAAEAVDAMRLSGKPLDVARLRRAFGRLWRVRRAACRAAAVTLASDRWGPIAVDLLDAMPLAARAGLALVGKHPL